MTEDGRTDRQTDRQTDGRTGGALQYLPSRAFGAAGDKNGCETTSQAQLGVHIIACNITNKINYEKKLGVKRPLKPSLCGHNYM